MATQQWAGQGHVRRLPQLAPLMLGHRAELPRLTETAPIRADPLARADAQTAADRRAGASESVFDRAWPDDRDAVARYRTRYEWRSRCRRYVLAVDGDHDRKFPPAPSHPFSAATTRDLCRQENNSRRSACLQPALQGGRGREPTRASVGAARSRQPAVTRRPAATAAPRRRTGYGRCPAHGRIAAGSKRWVMLSVYFALNVRVGQDPAMIATTRRLSAAAMPG
jgi:hypothetical protein